MKESLEFRKFLFSWFSPYSFNKVSLNYRLVDVIRMHYLFFSYIVLIVSNLPNLPTLTTGEVRTALVPRTFLSGCPLTLNMMAGKPRLMKRADAYFTTGLITAFSLIEVVCHLVSVSNKSIKGPLAN